MARGWYAHDQRDWEGVGNGVGVTGIEDIDRKFVVELILWAIFGLFSGRCMAKIMSFDHYSEVLVRKGMQ